MIYLTDVYHIMVVFLVSFMIFFILAASTSPYHPMKTHEEMESGSEVRRQRRGVGLHLRIKGEIIYKKIRFHEIS